MRITTAKKFQLIRQGKAYVGACDGGYFFYHYEKGEQDCVRISRDLFLDLNYAQLVLQNLKDEDLQEKLAQVKGGA